MMPKTFWYSLIHTNHKNGEQAPMASALPGKEGHGRRKPGETGDRFFPENPCAMGDVFQNVPGILQIEGY